MSLREWRYPIVELLVPAGYAPSGHRIVFRASGIYGFPLSYDDFTTGASDYDVSSDEIYCPCDAVMPWAGDAGDLLRRIDDHCRSTLGHPMPVRIEAY